MLDKHDEWTALRLRHLGVVLTRLLQAQTAMIHFRDNPDKWPSDKLPLDTWLELCWKQNALAIANVIREIQRTTDIVPIVEAA